MQVVCEISSGIGGNVSFSWYAEKVHVLQGADDFTGTEVPSGAIDLLRKVLVQDECEEAGKKVRFNAVISLEKDWSCLEVCLCDAEAVFDYPASSAQSDDFTGIFILEVGAYAVEAVEAGFLIYHLLIESITL